MFQDLKFRLKRGLALWLFMHTYTVKGIIIDHKHKAVKIFWRDLD